MLDDAPYTSIAYPFELYPDELIREARRMLVSAGSECLDNAGISKPGETVPPDLDIDAIWDHCVSITDALVQELLNSRAVRQILASLTEATEPSR
ncbi:hypothetical protein [Desertimonas flava]|uniref:hypothetical protein n=1 Tax=Desertimonas flava TaxID=2064846 RepID=UPI0013C4EC75|nr:hypothetical protein [Desertimonas flava]